MGSARIREGDRETQTGSQSPLLVGAGACAEGHISVNEDVCIKGNFKGELRTGKTVIITRQATFAGNLEATDITVHGHVQGAVRAHRLLTIGPGGSIHGNVTAKLLSIAAGGSLDGVWQLISAAGVGAADGPLASQCRSHQTADPNPLTELPPQPDLLKSANDAKHLKPLHLTREPFSNSPDPDFFYAGKQHLDCLSKIDLSLRMRKQRVDVITGDVGTGKTTLCRQLIRKLAQYQDAETFLLPDPYFTSPGEFLATLLGMWGTAEPNGDSAEPDTLLDLLEQELVVKCGKNKKRVILLVDEGQKAPVFVLEFLSRLLARGAEQDQWLHVLIFAQNEFTEILSQLPEFSERVLTRHTLKPLDFKETRALIEYRLRQASENGHLPQLFTAPALRAVHRIAGGFPRRIVHLCHWILLTLIIRDRAKANWSMVRDCSKLILKPDAH